LDRQYFDVCQQAWACWTLCWINTWTRISSFQISTSVKASLTSRKRNYRLYRSNLGCQAVQVREITFCEKS